VYIKGKMDITEKNSRGKNLLSIPFKRSNDRIARVIAPTTDEPMQVFLIEGGWKYDQPYYHVITEYGDYEESDYKFMSADEVARYLGVSTAEIYETRSFVVTPEFANSLPNDGDLGKRIRQKTISPF
jgi:hypothetical protein